MNIPATIVMPASAPLTEVANTAHLGAKVVQLGATLAAPPPPWMPSWPRV